MFYPILYLSSTSENPEKTANPPGCVRLSNYNPERDVTFAKRVFDVSGRGLYIGRVAFLMA